MAFDYEALVGHLYIVGGRSISAAPPGTLVEVAPRKAARGREADTFFTLVLPSGEITPPAAFYEQMAQLAAERYFNSSGSVTAGLRTVFSTLNENLTEQNDKQRQHYEASIVCAVLRGGDLYLGRCGSAVALFRHNGDTQAFPSDFSNDEALFGPPLGVQPAPDVKMAHYQVANGTRLVLADANLADLDLEKMKTAVSAADIGAVLLALKELIALQVTLLAVEFVPPEVPAPVPVREGESSRALTPPPAPSAPQMTGAPKEPRPRRRSGLPTPVGRGLGGAARGLAKVAGTLNRLLDRILPPPKEGQRGWLSSPAAAGAAILIPVVAVVVVVAMWVTGTGQSEFDLCVGDATKAADTARGIASSDVGGTLAGWNAVLAVIDRCDKLRSDDPTLAALTREAQNIIDHLLSVERRETTVVSSFLNASLSKIILQGENLYVLDNRNDQVYQVTLTTDGMGIVPNSQQPLTDMRRGGTPGALTVGDIFAIAWSQDGVGLSQPNELVAIDRTGVLVDCSPRFLLNCGSQRLLGAEKWVNPAAITLWQGRLYILDPGANQIWRYEPSGGAFSNAPTEYFSGSARADVGQAVDFGIDDSGKVYVLSSDGTLAKYFQGNPQDFGFANFPGGHNLTTADAMFLSTNPILPRIYIVNRADKTIYEATLAGTFDNSYRATQEDLFASIADVVVDPNLEIIYAISGNTILAFPRTPPPGSGS